MHAQNIVIAPPVRGHWAIYNPPGHPTLAFDFLAENDQRSLYRKGGFLRHLLSFIAVEDTFTWGSPVLAPVDGQVVASQDSEPDRKSISFAYDLVSLLLNRPKETDGFGAFGGNHILIRAGTYYVLLCHLKQGSARVGNGATVRLGQHISDVGNSGSSIQPHLHLQVMSNERYFPLFENLPPFRLTRARVKRGNAWAERENVGLESRGHYLFQ